MSMVIVGQVLPFSFPWGPTDGTRRSTGTVDAPAESHLGAGMHKYVEYWFKCQEDKSKFSDQEPLWCITSIDFTT